MSGPANDTGSYGTRLLIAWLFVGIPLVWGVVETGINAMKLFQ
jgi:hypothetical protein